MAITATAITTAVTCGDQNEAFFAVGLEVELTPVPVEEPVWVTVKVDAAYLPPTPETETL